MAQYADYADFGERYFRAADFEDAPRQAYDSYDPAEGAKNVDYDAFIDELETLTNTDSVILIVGCGTGVTVSGLHADSDAIDDVYGMDISEWAINNHAPGISQLLVQGDVREPDDLDDAMDEFSVNNAFDVIYTEFVLSHYDDADARTIHENCIDYVSHSGQQRGTVVHRMWSGMGADWENDWFNLKTVSEWQALVDDIDLDGVTVEWVDYDRPEDSTI